MSDGSMPAGSAQAPEKPRRILVTGAGGFVGRHLCAFLQQGGDEVVPLLRGKGGGSGAGWPVPEDLRRVEDAPDWPGHIDAVVHLAAANPARGETGAGDAAWLHAANVDGTAALARRAAREGVKRFVFLSTANVHAPRADNRPVTEHNPIAPQSPYAQSKADAETALQAELAGTDTRFCILRPVPVFGEGGRGTVAQLARLAKSPFPLPLKGLGGKRSLIAVPDLVEAIALAITAPGAANERLLIAGGAATPAEIVSALRDGAGRAPRLLPAPSGMLALLARTLGKGRGVRYAQRDFVVDTARATQLLGWTPSQDLVTRLRAAAAYSA